MVLSLNNWTGRKVAPRSTICLPKVGAPGLLFAAKSGPAARAKATATARAHAIINTLLVSHIYSLVNGFAACIS